MDFRFSPEEEKFRAEVKGFLKSELPAGWDEQFDTESEMGMSAQSDFAKAFNRKLAERRWLALPWPEEYGGLKANVMQQVIYNEEMAYTGAPTGFNMGVAWVGPSLMLYGTPEQKAVHKSSLGTSVFSTRTMRQDLASMDKTMRRRLIRPQRPEDWTSGAHRSNWGWIAARTDFEAPKHKGISMFLMPMDAPGISIRPLINMAGQHGFNEVFLEDVRIPATNLVGQENMGWYMLAVALDFERSSIAGSARARRILDEYVRFAHENKAAVDGKPEIRNRLAEISIEIDIAKYLSYRVASLQQSGKIPNYEATIAKLYSSELGQRLSNTGMQLLGLYGQVHPRSKYAKIKGLTERYYQMSVAETIAGGTSEVMRTVGAIRGLGLPRG